MSPTKFIRRPKGNKEGNKKKPQAIHVNDEEILFSIIKNRKSIRKYTDKDVPDSLIKKLLIAASHAPSAGNHQPWEFIIVKEQKSKQLLAEATFDQQWIADVPILIVACINMRLAKAIYGERGEKLYGIQSVAAAIQNMLLAATSLGLGSCWIGAFSEPHVSTLLHCPKYVRSCAIITIGYPAYNPKKPIRHSLRDFVHLETFKGQPQPPIH